MGLIKGQLYRCLDDPDCLFIPGSIVEVVAKVKDTGDYGADCCLVIGEEKDDPWLREYCKGDDDAVYCRLRELEPIGEDHASLLSEV